MWTLKKGKEKESQKKKEGKKEKKKRAPKGEPSPKACSILMTMSLWFRKSFVTAVEGPTKLPAEVCFGLGQATVNSGRRESTPKHDHSVGIFSTQPSWLRTLRMINWSSELASTMSLGHGVPGLLPDVCANSHNW